MSEQLKIIMFLKGMISDLIFINSIIATELIKMNENLAVQRHGEDFLKESKCIPEHQKLASHIIDIVDKYNKTHNDEPRKDDLKKHVLKHD
ncbi:MAG: hypothetical protein KGD73_07460 [Candidatus Lokiarchaeota archaeon]|nr:hypothetical protein [Candidatus Lokiarchaeota archaeon]